LDEDLVEGRAIPLRTRQRRGSRCSDAARIREIRVEQPSWAYDFRETSEYEGHAMGRAAGHYLIFETAGGFCGIAWNEVGITRSQLPTKNAEAAERMLLRRAPGSEPDAPPPVAAEAAAAVKRYFEGERTDFSALTLDLDDQDAFFQQIYAAARRVGWGRTTTYGTLAKELGAGPEAARDVGEAMARNPVPLIIPCHRILAAGGKVGGFSAPGGATAKMRMLELEGVHVAPPRPAQGSFVF
jgi:methylated-DNA-[protein]-cysteine S-methyltransferase